MINEAWGIHPVLFVWEELKISSYSVFVLLALIAGLLVFLYYLKKDHTHNANALYIATFALTFGTIGAKLPILFLNYEAITETGSLAILLTGRTIVGGLIGGMMGTVLAKKLFHIETKMGNQLAIPVAVGMAVGRIGCFLTGCCYGIETTLPWGVNFGDEVLRHPTQLYEIAFDLILVWYLIKRKKEEPQPGVLFKLFLTCYLTFRFLLEFIRVEEVVFLGLTAFQCICVVGVLYINREEIKRFLVMQTRRIAKIE